MIRNVQFVWFVSTHNMHMNTKMFNVQLPKIKLSKFIMTISDSSSFSVVVVVRFVHGCGKKESSFTYLHFILQFKLRRAYKHYRYFTIFHCAMPKKAKKKNEYEIKTFHVINLKSSSTVEIIFRSMHANVFLVSQSESHSLTRCTLFLLSYYLSLSHKFVMQFSHLFFSLSFLTFEFI